MVTRNEWIKANATKDGTWECYLKISPLCLGSLTIDTLTLDHVKSRSRHPELRFDLNNLKPCCSPCNTHKGSRYVEEMEKQDGRNEANPPYSGGGNHCQ